MSFMNLRLTSFALEHALGNLIFNLAFCLEISVGDLSLGNCHLDLFRLGTTAAYDLQLSICRFWLKICGSRSLAQNLISRLELRLVELGP